MSNLPRIFGMTVLGLALLVGAGTTQDKKDEKKTEKKKDEKKKDEKKAKDTLPPFFSKLELTAEQKTKITDVQNEYKPKAAELSKQIGELNKKLGELKKNETQDIFKVLNDAQKKKYDEEVAASKKKKEPEKKKTDK